MAHYTEPIEILMSKLGYSSKWLEYNALDIKVLKQQIENFKSHAHDSTEHYRYESFMKILGNHDALTDSCVSAFIELAECDSDQSMAGSVLGSLVQYPHLTESQFQYVYNHPALQRPWLQKIAKRSELLRALRNPNVTDSTVEKCIKDGDGYVHDTLLMMPGIKFLHLEMLMRHGANKSIRNRAKARLSKKRSHA